MSKEIKLFTVKEMFEKLDCKIDKVHEDVKGIKEQMVNDLKIIVSSDQRSKSNEKMIYGIIITLILGIGFEIIRNLI